MSKAGGTTQTQSTTSYPNFQQPYVQNLLSEAQRLYGQGGPQMYPDSKVAPFNPLESEGQQWTADAARTSLPAVANRAGTYSSFLLNEGLDPATNPYFQSSLSSAIRPIKEDLLNSALPAIRTQSRLAGTYGGSRQGIAEGLATKAAIEKAGDITSTMSSNAYTDAANRGQQTLNFLPTLDSLITAPGQTLSGVGEAQRGMSQAQLNDLVSHYEYNQQLPYTNLANYANLVSSPFGQQGTSQTVGPQASTGSQIAGGIASLPALIWLAQNIYKGWP